MTLAETCRQPGHTRVTGVCVTRGKPRSLPSVTEKGGTHSCTSHPRDEAFCWYPTWAEPDLPELPRKPRPAGHRGAEFSSCHRQLSQRRTHFPCSPWWRPLAGLAAAGPWEVLGFGQPLRAPPRWPLWAALPSVNFQGLGRWSLLTTAKAPVNGEPPDFGNYGCLFKALQTVYSQWGRVHRPGLPCPACPEGLRRRRTSGWCSHIADVLAGRAAGLGSTGRALAPAWPHTPSG